jgi:hypothetical protein
MNRKPHRLGAVALALQALAAPSMAGEPIVFGDGLTLDWRLGATYTLAQRMKSPDPLLAGRGNSGGNDGDNNFARHALTANRLALLLDTKLSKGDSGFVFSASTFYDNVYHRSNDNNPALSNPNQVNKPAPFNEFTPEARRYHGGYTRLLDFYGYTSFNVGESRATVRLGRHVVSWGEALFFPSISLAQGPADGTKTGIPGTEVKDQLLPEDQISATLQVNSRWSLLGHAQFNFHETIAPAPGSFLNSSDGVGPGASCLGPYSAIAAVPAAGFGGFSGCSFGPRGADIRPGRTGLWGVGTRYRVTDETEVGLYYLNYHDRTPLPEINAFTPGTAIPPALQAAFGGITQIGNGSYRIRYFDDVKLIGTTFSTTFGSVAVAGELSHKRGAPVLVNTLVNPATGATIANPARANVTQLNLNATANLGRSPVADSATLLGEIAAVRVGRIEARQAPGAQAFPAAFGFVARNDPYFNTRHGVAASATLALGYPGVFEGWDLSVPIAYSRQLSGRSLTGGVGGKGDARYSIGATFTRQGNLSIGVNYLGYLGGASLDPRTERKLSDRNQLSLIVKYAF